MDRNEPMERFGVKVQGLNAAFVGDAAHDTVANFNGAVITPEGQYPLSRWVEILSETPVGTATTIRFLERGKYRVTAMLSAIGVAGASTLVAGISVDQVLAGLALDPFLSDARVMASGSSGKAAADVSAHTIQLSADIEVTQQMVNTSAGITRIQISNGAGAGPTALSMTTAQCGFRIVKVSDLPGG